MDELQLKEMIRSLLNEMGGASAAKETVAILLFRKKLNLQFLCRKKSNKTLQ